MRIRTAIRKCLWKAGFDLTRFDPSVHPLARQRQLLKSFGIDVVLDVGANDGGFAAQLRDIGYARRIVSFEPLHAAFDLLRKRAHHDADWVAMNCALGERAHDTTINIAGNSSSSSLLQMMPSHLGSSPDSAFLGTQPIRVETLDSLFASLCPAGSRIYLKIDTQGYEDRVISGAAESLPSIDTLQIEMSLVPLYEGGLLFPALYQCLTQNGYRLVAIDPVFSDPATGQLLQVDGIFHRF